MIGYNLIKEFDVNKDSIPYYYQFNKRRLKTKDFCLIPCNKLYDKVETDLIDVFGCEDIFIFYFDQGSDEDVYEDCRNIITKNEENKHHLGKNVIFLDSYDGSELSNTAQNKISVLSYST